MEKVSLAGLTILILSFLILPVAADSTIMDLNGPTQACLGHSTAYFISGVYTRSDVKDVRIIFKRPIGFTNIQPLNGGVLQPNDDVIWYFDNVNPGYIFDDMQVGVTPSIIGESIPILYYIQVKDPTADEWVDQGNYEMETEIYYCGPFDLTAEKQCDSVGLSWPDLYSHYIPNGPIIYTVYRNDVNADPFSTLGGTSNFDHHFIDTSVTAGNTYFYRVKYDMIGWPGPATEGISDPITVNVPSCPPPGPSVPEFPSIILPITIIIGFIGAVFLIKGFGK